MTAQEPSQRRRLRLSLDQLHESRCIEIELHRSSTRMAASVWEASIP
jgi:hypothetical protein